MIHQAEMVIGIGIPWPVDLERAGRLTAIGVAQIRAMQRYSPLNSSIGLNGSPRCKPAIVEFNPPPAMSNSGKPEPASS